jgi:hypothetical protein
MQILLWDILLLLINKYFDFLVFHPLAITFAPLSGEVTPG